MGFGPGKAIYRPLEKTDLGTVTIAATTSNVRGGITSEGTTSCLKCLKGKVGDNRAIWCSAGWNYEYTQLKLDKAYPINAKGADINTS